MWIELKRVVWNLVYVRETVRMIAFGSLLPKYTLLLRDPLVVVVVVLFNIWVIYIQRHQSHYWDLIRSGDSSRHTRIQNIFQECYFHAKVCENTVPSGKRSTPYLLRTIRCWCQKKVTALYPVSALPSALKVKQALPVLSRMITTSCVYSKVRFRFGHGDRKWIFCSLVQIVLIRISIKV